MGKFFILIEQNATQRFVKVDAFGLPFYVTIEEETMRIIFKWDKAAYKKVKLKASNSIL